MDTETISNLKELGIATVAVIGAFFILYKSFMDQQKEHAKNQEWFIGFVNENNHQKTEMITEATKAMIEVRTSIENHNKITEKLLERLEK